MRHGRRRRFAASVAILRVEPAEQDSTSALADRDQHARVFDRRSLDHRTIVVLHQVPATASIYGSSMSVAAGVVVMTQDFPGTSEANRAELQAIVDSIRIEP